MLSVGEMKDNRSGKIVKYGVMGVASVALVIGGWIGFTELRIHNLLEETQRSLASGDIEAAENALDKLEQLDPTNDSSQLVSLSEDLAALQQSKAMFEAGLAFLQSRDYKQAYSKLDLVIKEDVLRYEDARNLYEEALGSHLEASLLEIESKLGSDDLGAYRLASEVMREFPDAIGFSDLKSRAEKSHASKVKGEAEKLVRSGFFISASKLIDKAQNELGGSSPAVRELNNWFDPIFKDAKSSALKNDMVARTDSFTGSTSYYYRGTYRTCCGGALQAADRFNLVIMGKSNPSLYLNVMLYQDDWVFADIIQANIDGSIWTIATDSYFGDSIERDNAYGSIWEYTGRIATSSDVSYFLKARESEKTKIRFQGDRNRSDFTVSDTMKLGIEKVLLAYLELGGSGSALLD